jgi:trans-aconitate methyltransferase
VSHLDLAGFEARYRAEGDPWAYTTSAYERDKYAATLAACGPGPFAAALELGASIGVFSELLADRCRRLVTIDGAPTAVAAARRRLATRPQVRVELGSIPEAIADERFDLIVASEILYYLEADALAATLTRLAAVALPGARVVAVHWRPAGPERPFSAEQVHATLHALDWLAPVDSAPTDDYLLDVFTRR